VVVECRRTNFDNGQPGPASRCGRRPSRAATLHKASPGRQTALETAAALGNGQPLPDSSWRPEVTAAAP
jgi:hypothetical protein